MKTKVNIIVIVLSILVATFACASTHMVKVERENEYSYGCTDSRVKVHHKERVCGLFNGKEIRYAEYSTLVDSDDLPWYNVWTETFITIR